MFSLAAAVRQIYELALLFSEAVTCSNVMTTRVLSEMSNTYEKEDSVLC